MSKKQTSKKAAKKPCIFSYWRSFSDAHWYWHITRRMGGKKTSDNQGYTRKASLLKSKLNDPSLNWDNIELVEIEDPNIKRVIGKKS